MVINQFLLVSLVFWLTPPSPASAAPSPSSFLEEAESGKEENQRIFHTNGHIDEFIVSGDFQTIYVASVNQLYSLSAFNLSRKASFQLGPVSDSPWCSADGKSCLKDHRPVSTDVHTKILQVLPNQRLLQCGSVKLGSCSMFSTNLELISTSTVPVAANSINSSTISLIVDNRLIVAASPTKESPYRDPFPAVTMRNLQSLHVENAGDLEGEAAVYLRASYRSSFKYIYTFQYENFVFIVATMIPRELRHSRTTRLIRFCRNDTKFISYSEIELQCRGEDNTNYPNLDAIILSDDKLIGSFSSTTASSSSSSPRSSICTFSLQRVKLTFWYNVDRCRSGTDSIKLAHIGRDTKCINKSHIPLDEDSCELGVGGSIELVEMSMKNIHASITSLMAIDKKAIFAGTSSSQIIMMKWDEQKLEEYGRKDVGDSRTGSDVIRMIRSGDNVIIQMPFGIVIEKLSTCSQYSSCSECLMSSDPLCQWCHPIQSCTTSSKCTNSLSTTCPQTEGEPIPNQVSINSTSEIVFKTKHLPPPNGFSYRCKFGDDKHQTKATWSSEGISCQSIKSYEASTIDISLLTSLSSKPIFNHSFTFYDCSIFTTCSQCSSSKRNCEWCSSTHNCVSKNLCSTGTKSNNCVKLSSMNMPIAIGSQQEIVLEASNLDTLDSGVDHFCKLNISGKEITSKAKLEQDSIRCGKMKLANDDDILTANVDAPLYLTTNQYLIDVINVSLYSCSYLAKDCSSCLALSPSLSCGWCNGRCAHDCDKTKSIAICDPPKIIRFEPTSGPVEGGTIIKIYGKDLGMSVEDVQGKIFVAGSRCDVIDYKVSSMISCRVDKGFSSGPIKISVGRLTMAVTETETFFSFVKVSVFSAYPLFGPVSGGTRTTLYGQHLNCGTNISITIGAKKCRIEKSNSSSSISCITPSGLSIGKVSQVIVTIDQASVLLDQLFEYRPDPLINSINPSISFKAGGKLINVEGQSLDSVLTAKMFLISSTTPPFEIISERSSCHILNATSMSCLTPKILETIHRRVDYSRFPVGFLMDNVTSVQNLGRRIQMNIYPNPQMSPFKGIRYHQGEQPLILEGHNLNVAAEPNDYKIFIGSERCYVTLVDVKQLVCSGPLKQPKPTDERGKSINGFLPLVTVIVGSIRTELGLIEYADQSSPSRLTILISVIFAIFLSGSMIVCAFWKRRRQEREKEYRKIQLQMENLENNVRKECKQAFAELQTNLILSPATKSSTPEYMQFAHFVENLLWSDSSLNSAPSLARTLPVTLAQFHALLSFKVFIFTIVEAAESDVSISTSERSMLASLLITVLLRNFSYCTEIVIDLLRAHISKAVNAKRGELLFRNSDSIVEKMVSKWISICLYSHITPQMNSFFYLYKALQYQTDKGPVDAVTGDARYTINESKLLRESVETTTLTICVSPFDATNEIIELEVHACDAICQLKQKVAAEVYKDTPYSQRPKITQFDLVFKCPRRGDIKLADVKEMETINQKSPIKLQTVADYGLTNGAILQIIPALYSSSSYRNSMADSGQSSWSSLDRCSPVYSSSKFYHLTNPVNGTMTFKRQKIFNDNIPKSIPEVYLTRLLTSKGTVQTYVEDFLESVLYKNETSFPPMLKYFFDILDREAAINGVSENICQQWKANGYILRVWANFVRNPKLIFDVPHSISMDANLSTVAQTLMDCFSFSEPILGAHSPSSRLLFAKDVAQLRPLSVDMFRRIKNSPAINIDELRGELVNMTNDVSTCKGSSLALSELLSWVRGNGIRISQHLSLNEEASKQRLSQKLSQVLNICLETDNHIYSTISDYD